MKSRTNTRLNLGTCDIAWRRKKIDCAEFMRVRFTIDSDWRRMSVYFQEYEIQTQIFTQDLNCIETKRNVDDVFN